MASVIKHVASRETYQKKGSYTSKFLYWKGFVDRHPLLASELAANVDAVFASWRTTGQNDKDMAAILDNWTGNGKENFKMLMKNMMQTAMVGGDAYAEILIDDITDDGGDVLYEEVPANIRILPPDSVTQEIEDGEIKKYVQHGYEGIEWQPEEMFHLAYGEIGCSTHGHSQIERLQNILLHKEQLLLTGSKIYELYTQPITLVKVKTDSTVEMNKVKTQWNQINQTDQKVLFIAEDNISDVVRVGVPQGSTLDPATWINNVLDPEIIKAFRTSEVMLGTGTVNSEESARYQFTGFRQMVRSNQSFMADNLKMQVFKQAFTEDTPSIKFSFATEAQEEEFKRNIETLTAISANVADPQLKELLTQKILIDMGLIPNV